MTKLTHLDLFSGIGGFALAAKWVGFKTVAFCEINPFCQEVIKKNFGKDSVIYDDIRNLTADSFRDGCNESTGGNSIRAEESGRLTIDLLTGGFPCQPFSCAGKRGGKNDDRFLWPEMLRVISEFKPRWIIGENVGGLVNMAQPDSKSDMEGETDTNAETSDELSADGILFGIIDSLENLGYTVQAFVIPACAVGAPHRRDMIWIVANSGCEHGEGRKERGEFEGQMPSQEDAALLEQPVGDDGQGANSNATAKGLEKRKQSRQVSPQTQDGTGMEYGASDIDSNDSNSLGNPVDVRGHGTIEVCGERRQSSGVQGCEVDSNSKRLRQQRQGEQEQSGDSKADRKGETNRTFHGSEQSFGWERNWLEVATELCSLDDGLPAELGKFKLSKSKHREEQLKGYGNAIVPQVVYEIMMAIQEIDNDKP